MRLISKKTVIWSAVILLAILLSIAGYAGYTYYMAVNGKGEVTVPQFTMTPDSKIKLGDDITLKTVVKCPWGHHPEKALISVPDGVQVVKEPTIRKTGTKWGKSLWEISAEIQPYRVGEMKEGKYSIDIITQKDGKTTSETVKGTLPGFKVFAVDTGQNRKLAIASTVKETSMAERNPWILIVIAILALTGAAIFFMIWQRKKREAAAAFVLPPWESALSLLHELRAELNQHTIPGQVCITRLTDIVRNYLEKRFNINAPSQTTQEFLMDLDKSDSPLEHEHKQFLKDFMTAADMVKFAKLPADKTLLATALDKAEQLVQSTTPKENNNEDL